MASKTNSLLVPADATSLTDLDNLIDKSVSYFGSKIDFVLHSIGMSINVRKVINDNKTVRRNIIIIITNFHSKKTYRVVT